MKLQKGNVVKITDDKKRAEALKSLGFKERPEAAKPKAPVKPKGANNTGKDSTGGGQDGDS